MSDDSMDKPPAFNRVSIRAVVVEDGEDPGHALAEAGFAEAVAIPVVLGEDLNAAGGILGNGVTPNLTAVLEADVEDDEENIVVGTRTDQARATAETPPSSGPVTTNLPAANGGRPLAPVRKRGG